MCFKCGQPDYVLCNCGNASQPYCDQCTGDEKCDAEVDLQCAIYHRNDSRPSKLTCLGIPNDTSAEIIFETIDKRLCQIQNDNAILTVIDTNTVDLSVSGNTNNVLKADVKISDHPGNIISSDDNGIYALDSFKVKVDVNDIPDYLENQIIGKSNGFLAISVIKNSGTGMLDVTPSYNLLGLIPELCALQPFHDCIVSHETPLTVVDSSTVDLSASGEGNHTLKADVKVSALPGNGLLVVGDGLYVASGNTDITFNNALTRVLDNVQFGGPLVKNTLVSDYNYNLLFQNKTVQVGNLSDISYAQSAGFLNSEGLKFRVYNKSPFQGGGCSPSVLYGQFILEDDAAISSTEHINYGLNAGMLAFFKDSVTYTKDTQDAGIGGQLGIGTANTPTVNTGNPLAAFRATVFLMPGSSVGEPNSTAQGTIQEVAAFYAGIPSKDGGVTPLNLLPNMFNYYGLYIDNPDIGGVSTKITNKWGVYQVGGTSTNRFFGPVQNSGGGTEFTSDLRIKENVILYSKGLDIIEKVNPVYYDYKEFTANPKKGVIGVIAQDLEKVFPEAVSKTIMYGYDDFRMVNESYLIYTLINAVKQLNEKVKHLESIKS